MPYDVDFREIGNLVGWVIVNPSGRAIEGFGPYSSEKLARDRADWLAHREEQHRDDEWVGWGA